MKIVFFTYLLMFLSNFIYAQNWKDSLSFARKLYKEGSYSESLRVYKSTQKIAPKNVNLSDEVGQSAYKAEEFKEAENIFNRSSAKKGNAVQKSKAYHNLGNAKLKQKKYEEAIEAYKESLRNNPNDEETRYNLTEALKRKKAQDKKENQDQSKSKDKQKNKPTAQNEDKKQENQENKKQNNSPEKKIEQEESSKLSDKKTERMLDDLVKKEIETKKKLGGNKGKQTNNKSGKDW